MPAAATVTQEYPGVNYLALILIGRVARGDHKVALRYLDIPGWLRSEPSSSGLSFSRLNVQNLAVLCPLQSLVWVVFVFLYSQYFFSHSPNLVYGFFRTRKVLAKKNHTILKSMFYNSQNFAVYLLINVIGIILNSQISRQKIYSILLKSN